jgi:hypothetical protein
LLLRRHQFADGVDGDLVQPHGARRQRRGEGLGVEVRRHIPVAEARGELGRAGDPFAGDDVLHRQRLLADLDPDLPVHVLRAERQVMAFDPVDEGRAQIGSGEHIGHQSGVRIGEEEIPRGRIEAGLVAQRPDRGLDVAPRRDVRVHRRLSRADTQRLAVEQELALREGAAPLDPQPIRPLHRELHAGAVLQFLPREIDRLGVGIDVYPRRGQRRQILGHHLQAGVGVGVDGWQALLGMHR